VICPLAPRWVTVNGGRNPAVLSHQNRKSHRGCHPFEDHISCRVAPIGPVREAVQYRLWPAASILLEHHSAAKCVRPPRRAAHGERATTRGSSTTEGSDERAKREALSLRGPASDARGERRDQGRARESVHHPPSSPARCAPHRRTRRSARAHRNHRQHSLFAAKGRNIVYG
jgi:hypothetical protein